MSTPLFSCLLLCKRARTHAHTQVVHASLLVYWALDMASDLRKLLLGAGFGQSKDDDEEKRSPAAPPVLQKAVSSISLSDDVMVNAIFDGSLLLLLRYRCRCCCSFRLITPPQYCRNSCVRYRGAVLATAALSWHGQCMWVRCVPRLGANSACPLAGEPKDVLRKLQRESRFFIAARYGACSTRALLCSV